MCICICVFVYLCIGVFVYLMCICIFVFVAIKAAAGAIARESDRKSAVSKAVAARQLEAIWATGLEARSHLGFELEAPGLATRKAARSHLGSKLEAPGLRSLSWQLGRQLLEATCLGLSKLLIGTIRGPTTWSTMCTLSTCSGHHFHPDHMNAI